MNINDFEVPEQRGYNGGSWENFTLGDEKRAKRRFSRFFLALSAYTLISYVIISAVFLIIELMGLSENAFFASTEFTVLMNVVAMYLIAFPVFYLCTREMRNATRYKTKVNIKEFAMLFFVSYTLMQAGSLIGTFVTDLVSGLTGKEVIDDTAALIEQIPMWLTVIVPVVIGPIVEELMFRKFLMDKLGTYGDRTAIVVSAVAFGLFHGNLSQLFYAVLIGFVLGYIYAKTANVIYPIIMHMLLNFFGSIVPLLFLDSLEAYIKMSEEIAAGATVDMELFAKVGTISAIYSFITFTIIGLGIFIIFKFKNRFFLSDRCEIEIPRAKRASVILLNAGAIVFMILSLAIIVLDIIF